MATIPQALLALYGALDEAVTGTGDQRIEAVVERYLPRSTGADAGWYEQLLGFLAGPGPHVPGASAPPDLDQALTALQGSAGPKSSRRTATAGPASVTVVQASRMVYAIGALSHLPGHYPPEHWHERFARTLTVAGAPGGGELLDLLQRSFDGRADWPQVMASAVRDGLIDAAVAAVPLCQARPKWVRGHQCVVLTTDFSSAEVSLDQLTNVVDPLNWPRCLSFFCRVQPEPARPDGWSRALEHFGPTCRVTGTPQLATPLKYWKGPRSPEPTAFLDYAIDDDPVPGEHGDGRLVIDEGFIRMTSTVGDPTKAGVRVRTRKVAGFRNLAWLPAAIFACVIGYGNEGAEMLLSGVAQRAGSGPKGWTDWEPSRPAAPTGSPRFEQLDPGRRAVTLAIDMLTECVDEMSGKGAALASRWAAGGAPVDESMAFAADLAARLATDPWRYLDRLGTPAPGGDR